MKKFSIGILLLLPLTIGCSTYRATRYSMNPDHFPYLKQLNGKAVNVVDFTATDAGSNSIMCRGAGPIKTPADEPFSTYIRSALVDELKIAEAYSPASPVTISGNLDKIDFDSMAGNWTTKLTLKSSNGETLPVASTYTYRTFYIADRACEKTASEFSAAVGELIRTVITDPMFLALLPK